MNANHMCFDYIEGYNSTLRRSNRPDFTHYIDIGKESFQKMHDKMLIENKKINEKTPKKR